MPRPAPAADPAGTAELSADDRAVFLRIEGQVQGVGYRAFVQEQALSLGVTGWVVNREDGSVEAALYGRGTALGELITRLRQGPPAAQVESLDVRSTHRGQISDVPRGGYAF